MKRALREKVWEKYNKRCAYCGKPIEYKDMQVDHAFPQSRKHWLESEKMMKFANVKNKDINHIENLNPSCRRCNHYKRAVSVEGFRELLADLHLRIQKQYIDKVAIDYGIIKIIPFDGIFYFEKDGE